MVVPYFGLAVGIVPSLEMYLNVKEGIKLAIHYFDSLDGARVCLTLVKCWITSSEKPRWALTKSGGVRANHCERETSWKTSFCSQIVRCLC